MTNRQGDVCLPAHDSYTYDIFGRRIVKTIDADGAGSGTAVEEIYIYDGLREEQGNAGDHILLAFDEFDALTHRYLHGPEVDQVLASEEVTGTSSAGNVLWALTDHLGTVRDLLDYDASTDTASVVNHLEYDAFGHVTAESNTAVDFLFGFTGREWDEESGLQYNRARYYDALAGRWIAEDPIGFTAGDSNLTRYLDNSPLQYADPSGLQRQGHHIVPQAVIKALGHLFEPAAVKFLKRYSIDPGYDHGWDTWLGVTHGQYNSATKHLLLEYKKHYAQGKYITQEQACDFVDFLQGKKNLAALGGSELNESALRDVRKWLKGFSESQVNAAFISTLDIDDTLSKQQRKSIIRRMVNEGKAIQDIDELKPLIENAGGSKVVARLLKSSKFLRAAGPALGVLGALSSTQQAIACEGPLAERIRERPVSERILHQIAYDAVFGEQVESSVLGLADYLEDIFGLGGPSKKDQQIQNAINGR